MIELFYGEWAKVYKIGISFVVHYRNVISSQWNVGFFLVRNCMISGCYCLFVWLAYLLYKEILVRSFLWAVYKVPVWCKEAVMG